MAPLGGGATSPPETRLPYAHRHRPQDPCRRPEAHQPRHAAVHPAAAPQRAGPRPRQRLSGGDPRGRGSVARRSRHPHRPQRGRVPPAGLVDRRAGVPDDDAAPLGRVPGLAGRPPRRPLPRHHAVPVRRPLRPRLRRLPHDRDVLRRHPHDLSAALPAGAVPGGLPLLRGHREALRPAAGHLRVGPAGRQRLHGISEGPDRHRQPRRRRLLPPPRRPAGVDGPRRPARSGRHPRAVRAVGELHPPQQERGDAAGGVRRPRRTGPDQVPPRVLLPPRRRGTGPYRLAGRSPGHHRRRDRHRPGVGRGAGRAVQLGHRGGPPFPVRRLRPARAGGHALRNAGDHDHRVLPPRGRGRRGRAGRRGGRRGYGRGHDRRARRPCPRGGDEPGRPRALATLHHRGPRPGHPRRLRPSRRPTGTHPARAGGWRCGRPCPRSRRGSPTTPSTCWPDCPGRPRSRSRCS